MIKNKLKYTILSLILLAFAELTYAQFEHKEQPERLYQEAFDELRLMLRDSVKPNFKRAVFLVENAYRGGDLNYESFSKLIGQYGSIIREYMKSNPLPYKGEDSDIVLKNYAIFKFMTDTVWLNKGIALHYPYTYNFDDYMGESDWKNMFITTLIQTHRGNCHSMPFLYKILAEELGAEAYLSLAPYHIYIKSRSEKTGWFNTELTNAMFPVDAWVAASGYVTLDAMRSSIYMDTLGLKQSIAFCLYDLAKGCERKFGFQRFPFVFECLDLALEYHPNFINAHIYRAECLKKRLDIYMRLYNAKDFKEILAYDSPKEIHGELEAQYNKILNLGFREMPPKMYREWLESLKSNKEKYQNNKILFILQKK